MTAQHEASKSINILVLCGLTVAAMLLSPNAHAQSFSVILNFDGTNGSSPLAGLVMDSSQNLYGTVNAGGQHGLGAVFKANRNGQEVVLHSFAGAPQTARILRTA